MNAVGLSGNRVASASGDGKMILWDIASGEKVRTFEGHDRGLACIEFKVSIFCIPSSFIQSWTNNILLNRMILSCQVPMIAKSKYGPLQQGNVFAPWLDMISSCGRCLLILRLDVWSALVMTGRLKSGI